MPRPTGATGLNPSMPPRSERDRFEVSVGDAVASAVDASVATVRTTLKAHMVRLY
jgi:hypothetical protein